MESERKESQIMLLLEPVEEECAEEKGTVSTFLQSRIHESFTRAADQLYAMGVLTTEERIAISSCIGDALEAFANIMQEKVPEASEMEVPVEVAQEILRNAILHRRQGIIKIAQEEELGVPISSEYLDLPDRDQDHRTLRELIELALIDEVNAQQHYDNMLEVVEQMDLPVEMDSPNRKALEEIFSDERDHEKILERMLEKEARLFNEEELRATFDSLPEESKREMLRGLEEANKTPIIASTFYELLVREGRHAFDKCMRCSASPTLDVHWADGRAHAWFCDKHFEEWIEEEHDRKNGSDIVGLKEITDGVASKHFTDNPNPNIRGRFFKEAILPETEEEIGDPRFWQKAWSRFLATHGAQALPATEEAFYEELIAIKRAAQEGFRFDPNSTENEGRWRLIDPKVFEQGSIRRWNIWKEIKAPGIQFVMGKDTRDNEWKPQAVRFKKFDARGQPLWTEEKAAKWWDQNKGEFEKEWTQSNWDEWMQKHPGEISPDYTGQRPREAFRLVQFGPRGADLDTPRTLAIDLDGTVLEYDGHYNVGVFGPPKPGARETLSRFKDDGWFLVIDTCRGEVPLVVEHLALYDIPFDAVNFNPFQPDTANPGKPIANYRIDDSAIYFNGDWDAVYDEVMRRDREKELFAVKVAWVPPVDVGVALWDLSNDLMDREWVSVLPYVDGTVVDEVIASWTANHNTYRMVRCGSEYKVFRNFDVIYRSGGSLSPFEQVRVCTDIVESGTSLTTPSTIVRDAMSDLLAHLRNCSFNTPSEWLRVIDWGVNDGRRVMRVGVDLKRFEERNPALAVFVANGAVPNLLRCIAHNGAFAYDPQRGILIDFLDPFGHRTQPQDYRDPAYWGVPEELKERARRRRERKKRPVKAPDEIGDRVRKLREVVL